jgi:pimeloyl-ACP methyl ester carboxylesterase
MPAVLVHGVPDTAAMWDPVRAGLRRDDVVALALPGFATPVPEGFGATKEDYAAWLTEELVAIGEPVDLVGHDWGSILVQRVASTRPELVRTLACGSGPVDRAYTWHPMAQLWQTPVTGEEVVAGMLALPRAEYVAAASGAGTPADLAALQADHLDELMGRSILALYRSAVTVGAEWEGAVAAMPRRPVSVLWGADDPYVTPDFGERLARRVAGDLVVFDGCGHWWPWERAEATATALERLWAAAR